MTKPQTTIEDRFWSKVKRGKEDDCWEWQGARFRQGYGAFTNKTTKYAHRMAYILTYGSIPEGMFILHKCDNPPCCNPKHLWLGTQADNVHDRYNKRHSKYYPLEKLGDKSKSAIRLLYATGFYTMQDLASMCKVSQSYISLIVAKKR